MNSSAQIHGVRGHRTSPRRGDGSRVSGKWPVIDSVVGTVCMGVNPTSVLHWRRRARRALVALPAQAVFVLVWFEFEDAREARAQPQNKPMTACGCAVRQLANLLLPACDSRKQPLDDKTDQHTRTNATKSRWYKELHVL